jgi:uncharacterized membrane protein YhaH (DUF805 family)
MNPIFSTNGKIGRGVFALRLFLITAGTFAAAFAMGKALGPEKQPVVDALAILIGVSGWVLGALQTVKRLHDLGRPSADYFLLWLPAYSLTLNLQLLFRKGPETPEQR